VPYPIPDWPTGTPESQGLDPAGLFQASEIAKAHDSFCLLVIRHGVLVWESYFNGSQSSSTNPSWSIAKSYTGTLVGIALARGEIASLDDSAAKYVPEWQGQPQAAIRIRDLITMTSGLRWSLVQDYVELVLVAPDQTAFALQQPLTADAGTQWTYDNAAVQVLERVFRGATGMTIEEYARLHLWSRLGMQASWAHDSNGHPTTYANVLATCRDHARLGYLFLHQGNWAGEQVVPASFVAEAIAPSQPFNLAYGYLWWRNGGPPAEDAMNQSWSGAMVPFAPPDLFAAHGFGNQFIDVIPSRDLVVVRFGKDPLGHGPDGGFVDAGFDLAALAVDAHMGIHDLILQPILGSVHD
jgi:CubicO group peptidase (beta-lactamase class C family)